MQIVLPSDGRTVSRELGRAAPLLAARDAAQYVEAIALRGPGGLRMEFLNNARNTELYRDDPLAPERYDPACLFAITMFSSPLAWFETTGLSSEYRAAVAPLIATWKQHRDRIYQGTILPIGDVPDGVNWTGFTSTDGEGSGYLLAFREANEAADWGRALSSAGQCSVAWRERVGIPRPGRTLDGPHQRTTWLLWVRIDAATAAADRGADETHRSR